MMLQKSYADINNSFAACGNFVYRRTGFSYYSRVIYSTIIMCGTSCRRADGTRRSSRIPATDRLPELLGQFASPGSQRTRERERERGGGETDGDDGNDGEAETAFLRIIYSPASTPGRSIMHPLKSTGVRNCPVKFRR